MQIYISKKLMKWLIIVVIFAAIYITYIVNIDRFQPRYPWAVEDKIISHVLGIATVSNIIDSETKNIYFNPFPPKLDNILNISKKEWDGPACLLEDQMDCYVDVGEKCKIIPAPEKIKPLKECIFLSTSSDFHTVSKYCNKWNIDDCISFWTYDYVLQRPDILNKIVEVLKNPCKYIPTKQELLSKGLDQRIYDTDMKDLNFVDDVRKNTFHCDKKNKKPHKIIILVKDRHHNWLFDIVIGRNE